MRQSALEADDPRIPEWPDEHVCKLCGCAVWQVFGPDGALLVVDVDAMETELVEDIDGVRRRLRAAGSYRFPNTRAVSGWRLLDPVRVKYGPEAGWYWYVGHAGLDPLLDETQYSEHRFTCGVISQRSVTAALYKTVATGERAGDPRLKQRGAAARARKALQREALAQWAARGGSVPLPSDVGAQHGGRQMSLLW